LQQRVCLVFCLVLLWFMLDAYALKCIEWGTYL
jgi:hypothetical protein